MTPLGWVRNLVGVAAITLAILFAPRCSHDEPRQLTVYGDVGTFSFENHDGRSVGPETLRGAPWILDFIFTSCTGTCSVMSQRMQALQGALADVPDLKLVSITCDPDRDTKERLAQYSKGYNADPDRWFFVTGDKQSIQSFSIQTLKLGMQEATSEEQAKGMERIIHSSRLVLIDAKGRIRAYHNGIEEGATKRVADDVRALLAER